LRQVGKGRNAASVVLVGLDTESVGTVREILQAEAVLPPSSVSFGDALGVIKRTRPDVVIVGMFQTMDAALALAQAVSRDEPGVVMIALADKGNADAILSSMRVGYKEYVVLPNDAPQLRQAVHDAAYKQVDEDVNGLVVSMVGAKGGVGTTLLATHLAAELAAIHRVLCIDLDFGNGDVASVLDLTPRDSLVDLLPRADRIDERMLTGSVGVHRSKVHALTQPNEYDHNAELRGDDIYSIILAAARGYQYVLVDCGSYINEPVGTALQVADLVALVTTPDVIAVRDAYRRIKSLGQLGVETENIRLIVNRNSKTSFVSIPDIEENLGMKVSAIISDDPRTVGQAMNEGKLVREINRRCDVARELSNLVAALTADPGEAAAATAAPDSGFFSRLFKSKG
jgi:pilus assembly protein CpaE